MNDMLALLGAYHEPYSSMHRGECRVCHLWAASDNELELQVALVMHVGRMHPEEYFLTTGHEPTESWLKHQEYLMREGVI
jgi:hypothetical protein